MEKGKWFKSSRSNGTGGNNCVEVFGSTKIFVRHSDNRRTMIAFTPAEWAAFVEGVKAGEFDL